MKIACLARAAAFLALLTVPAAAQAPDATLAARMRAFAEAAPGAPNDSVAAASGCWAA